MQTLLRYSRRAVRVATERKQACWAAILLLVSCTERDARHGEAFENASEPDPFPGFEASYDRSRAGNAWMLQLPLEANLAAFAVGQPLPLGEATSAGETPWVFLLGPLPGMLAVVTSGRFAELKAQAVKAGVVDTPYTWPTVSTHYQAVSLGTQPYALYAETTTDGITDAEAVEQFRAIGALARFVRVQANKGQPANYAYPVPTPADATGSRYPPGTNHLRGDLLAYPGYEPRGRDVPPASVRGKSLAGFVPPPTDAEARAYVQSCRDRRLSACSLRRLVVMHLHLWNLWEGKGARTLRVGHSARDGAPLPRPLMARPLTLGPATSAESLSTQLPVRTEHDVLAGDHGAFEEFFLASYEFDLNSSTPWLNAYAMEPVVPYPGMSANIVRSTLLPLHYNKPDCLSEEVDTFTPISVLTPYLQTNVDNPLVMVWQRYEQSVVSTFQP